MRVKTTYQPMLELLAYLRENGFKTYISSGGGVDLMRVIAMDTYGIVPENVLGTFAIDSFEQVDGEWKIVKSAKNMFLHDALTKPVGIKLRIGRIPILLAEMFVREETLANSHIARRMSCRTSNFS